MSLGLLLVCLGLELGLRLYGDRERAFADSVNRTNQRWVTLLQGGVFEEIDDPVRRYAMCPGSSAEVDGWTFRVNEHRARGPEFPLEKPANEKRILCVGDSFAFGLWCDEEETLVGHVARMANEAEAAAGGDTHWRGITIGVPGYHTGQQLRALQQDGMRLDPDVVLLYYNTNDIQTEGLFLDEDLGALRADFLPLPVGLRRALWHSHLYGLFVRTLERSRTAPEGWPHIDPATQQATAGVLRDLGALCKAAEVPLFFVNQPLLSWTGDLRRPDWWARPLVDWAEERAREMGVPSYSLLGFLRGYRDGVDRMAADGSGPPWEFLPEQYVADVAVQDAVQHYLETGSLAAEDFELPSDPDFHFTGAGYAELARLIYPGMQAAGLVP
jgi:lysophospholipase L1-like esterase